jgi:hypothetical protein
MNIASKIIGIIAGILILFGTYSGKINILLIGLIPVFLGYCYYYIIVRARIKKITGEVDAELEQLKEKWEKILVDFDNCEFKDSSYSEDMIDERMSRFGHLNFNYGKVIGQEQHEQSLIIFHLKGINGSEKFVHAFPFSAEALKVYVIQNLLSLYIDPGDRRYFFFDLKDN